MFIVQSYWQAIVFCAITMLCWGSWANTQKLTSKSWQFELFYWDYVIGILLFSLLSALTLGSIGEQGRHFVDDLAQADGVNFGKALIGGVIFNAANILLSAAIAIAGMAVAFPVGIGLALILGVLVNYLGTEKGDPVLLFAGVAFVLFAILINALNLIAAGKAGPAISYGLGQGATLVAAFWGVAIWKEFKGATARNNVLIAVMFLFFLVGLGFIIYAGKSQTPKAAPQLGGLITMPGQVMKDKIKGGWAGQTIGVTFGGPYEFRYNGTFIQDYQPLFYSDGYIRKTMLETPGLYDDLYMDLTFVDVFERLGLDAPVDSFANAFAHAGYQLWHANQAARYNILHGIKAPESGNWINSPHADDIDYQIESDYAGLMSPGMPNTASAISDKIGHIMNYGDGWYGGVYFGALYSLAFLSNDVNYVVNEALKAIPANSTYYQCMADVIGWHKKYPADWHQTWFELQKKWSSDKSCPEGIFLPFDIDATINSAYVVMALLYGNGDFGKTLDIAARAGQDADCNPSSVGGILGTLLGYDKIPPYWKNGLTGAEDIYFKYTTISLNKVYEIGFKHALENIKRNGGHVDGTNITIRSQQPAPVRFEKSFPGLYPVQKESATLTAGNEIHFDFEGTGFILNGFPRAKDRMSPDYVFKTEVWLDGKKIESPDLPTDFTTRRLEVCWKYPLPKGKHTVQVKILNPDSRYEIGGLGTIVFSDKPAHDPFLQ